MATAGMKSFRYQIFRMILSAWRISRELPVGQERAL
jgi:hypothetical protein